MDSLKLPIYIPYESVLDSVSVANAEIEKQWACSSDSHTAQGVADVLSGLDVLVAITFGSLPLDR